MKLDCPECKTTTEIPLREGRIPCKHCKSPLDKLHFSVESKKKSAILVIASILTGGVIQNQTSETNQQERYPIQEEYEIIKMCADLYTVSTNITQYKIKTMTCICGLEKTSTQYKFEQYKKYQNDFMRAFEENINHCLNGQ